MIPTTGTGTVIRYVRLLAPGQVLACAFCDASDPDGICPKSPTGEHPMVTVRAAAPTESA